MFFLAFQSFDYERIWWRLFQKRVVRIKFDIYVFITNGVAILVLSKWRLHDFHIKWCRLTVTRWCNMWRRTVTIPEHLSSPPIRVALSLVFRVMFCWSLFVLLPFFFWPLYCLSFFDWRLLIASSFSCMFYMFIRQYTVSTQVIQALCITYSRLQNLTKL